MLDYFNSNQKKIILGISAIIVIVVLFIFYNKTNTNDTVSLDENILIKENSLEEDNTNEDNKNTIIVHITGEIKTPGIVKLPEGSRMEDAINAAGGLTENSDISGINLAYILEDGIKIKIPSLLENNAVTEEIITKDNEENIIENENKNNVSSNNSMNINTAKANDLKTLPGIGETLAIKIIEYRDQNGKFKNIEDIKNVNGVGETKFENIKDLICVK